MKREESLPARHEEGARRPALGFRHATVFIGLGVAIAFALQFGCDDWPPGDRNDAGGGNSPGVPQDTNGVCSGTPLPCAALVGAECTANAGCHDNGSCVGTATNIGQSCSTSSPTDCAGIPGCVWSGSCTGTPYGTCSAFTQASCVIAKGCVWTPNSTQVTGSGGSSGTCLTYLASCTSNLDCDCSLSCVKQCPSCASVCGIACLADSQCTGTSTSGISTPYCKMVLGSAAAAPYSGLCSQTR
ncbi:MAG TPA: hypothetical protein VF395_02670 [Polyangiaceae bacterium]